MDHKSNRDPHKLNQHRVALDQHCEVRDRKLLFLLAAVVGIAAVLFSPSPPVETHASTIMQHAP